MDQRDRDILRELLKNGRLTNSALARSVGLSDSATYERVRRLEGDGTIQGYMARVDPAAVGRGIEAIIHIQLSHHQQEDVDRFLGAMQSMDEVLSCYAVAGRYDFIARVAVHSMDDFERLVTRRLLQLKAIDRVETMFVLKTIKREGSLVPWEPPDEAETQS